MRPRICSPASVGITPMTLSFTEWEESFNYQKLSAWRRYHRSSAGRRLGHWTLLYKFPQCREAVREREVILNIYFAIPPGSTAAGRSDLSSASAAAALVRNTRRWRTVRNGWLGYDSWRRSRHTSMRMDNQPNSNCFFKRPF